jgi:hypothetical protein
MMEDDVVFEGRMAWNMKDRRKRRATPFERVHLSPSPLSKVISTSLTG